MSVQAISSAASSAQLSADGQAGDFSSGRISELTMLEQSIQKMKAEYKSYAEENSVSQATVTAKVKQLDSLIAKVEQQINQIKREKKKQSVGNTKRAGGMGNKTFGDGVILTYKKAMSISIHTPAVIASLLSEKSAVKVSATVTDVSEIKNTEKSALSVASAMQNLGEAQINDFDGAVEAAFSSGLDILV